MRTLVGLLLATVLSFTLMAQEKGKGKGGPKAPPKNLKILTPDNYFDAMRSFTQALGVQCDFCHEQDRSSDAKPQKNTARMMLTMTREINAKFPDGQQHVRCYTCHRGSNKPLTEPPAQ